MKVYVVVKVTFDWEGSLTDIVSVYRNKETAELKTELLNSEEETDTDVCYEVEEHEFDESEPT